MWICVFYWLFSQWTLRAAAEACRDETRPDGALPPSCPSNPTCWSSAAATAMKTLDWPIAARQWGGTTAPTTYCCGACNGSPAPHKPSRWTGPRTSPWNPAPSCPLMRCVQACNTSTNGVFVFRYVVLRVILFLGVKFWSRLPCGVSCELFWMLCWNFRRSFKSGQRRKSDCKNHSREDSQRGAGEVKKE